MLISTDAVSYNFIPTGAGGQLTSLDIAPDGTKVIRCDAATPYIWDVNHWRPLMIATTMPVGYSNLSGSAGAVWEICLAYSNTKRMYFVDASGNTYRSDNSGYKFTQCVGFPTITGLNFSPNINPWKFFNQKMAVDPNNQDIVYNVTGSGVYVSFDAGATASLISTGTIPAQLSNWSGGLAFDTSGGTTTVSGQTRTKNIFLTSYGNGVYNSTDGGVTWTQIANGTSSPINVRTANVDASTSTSLATYYCMEYPSNNLWRYQNGTWTQITLSFSPTAWPGLVVDHSTPGRLLVVQGGGGQQSLDYGSTFVHNGANIVYGNVAPSPGQQTLATDIPWLAQSASVFFGGDARMDPTTGLVCIATGVGFFTAPWPTTYTAFNWTSQSLGIQELVSNDILAPASGNVIVSSWDRPIFVRSKSQMFSQTYPSTYYPAPKFNNSWDSDYASSDPNFICSRSYFNNTAPFDASCFSTDGGVTWSYFPTTIGTTAQNGCIAAASPTNIVMLPGAGRSLYNTKDQGNTWNIVSGAPTGNWVQQNFLCSHILAADRVNIGTFYAYNAITSVTGVLYSSTDGGDNWTAVFNSSITTGVHLANGDGFNARLRATPGNAGHLWYTAGSQTGNASGSFFTRSTDGGVTWNKISVANGFPHDIESCRDFGFGAIASGATYPSIYICGLVDKVFGCYVSRDAGQSWKSLGYPNSCDYVKVCTGDMNDPNRFYLGMSSGAYYGQVNT